MKIRPVGAKFFPYGRKDGQIWRS